MNKFYLFLLISIFCHFSSFAEKCGFSNSSLYNFSIPHVNKGTLTKISYTTAIKVLNLTTQNAMAFEKEYMHKGSGMRYYKYLSNGEKEIKYRTPEIKPIAAYKQDISEEGIVLYRLMFEYKFSRNLISYSTTRQIYQKVYLYSPKTQTAQLIFADFYHTTLTEESKPKREYCKNVMPIIKEQKLAGIVIYGIEKYTEEILNGIDVKYKNHQNHFADIYWMNDLSLFKIYDLPNDAAYESDIHIEASWPLFHSKDLFNYTIQNAFDNNSNTCFEENTPDNLIDINIDFKEETDITLIALINGQAENKESYFNNNQIIEFSVGYSNSYWDPIFSLTPIMQIHVFEKSVFKLCTGALKIKKGRRYNDTCISEFNICLKDKKWLFYHIM